MERRGERNISVKYTRDDFLRLHLSETGNDNWEMALEIFNDRIKGRFFDPIEILMKQDINQTGFAIMALNCLLVETLYQFNEGVNETGTGNGNLYADFLTQIMPEDFCKKAVAKRFYKDIRCGILHSAQTKDGSQLTFDKPYVVETFEGKKLRVNVERFTERLSIYYRSYCDKLLDEKNIELRKKFIEKMNFICAVNR